MSKSDEAKKSKELKQLRRVCSKDKYPNVVASENPDFIVDNGNKFGVELVEYYQDDSSGRFANVPNYLNRLVDDGFIHPRDKGIIEVVEPQVEVSPGVWHSLGKASYKPILSADERIKRLILLIDAKHKKYKNYDRSLAWIDLLVIDKGDLYSGTEKRQTKQYLRDLQKNNPQLSSPFKNIYIYTDAPGKRNILHLWNNQ